MHSTSAGLSLDYVGVLDAATVTEWKAIARQRFALPPTTPN